MIRLALVGAGVVAMIGLLAVAYYAGMVVGSNFCG